MRRSRDERDLLAFAVAPVVATILWMVTAFAVLAWFDGFAAAHRDIPSLVIGGLLVGMPLALGAVVLLAGPVFVVLTYYGRVTLGTTLLTGAGIGSGAAWIAGQLVDGLSLITPGIGLVVGLGTAATWWLVAGKRVANADDRHTDGRSSGCSVGVKRGR